MQHLNPSKFRNFANILSVLIFCGILLLKFMPGIFTIDELLNADSLSTKLSSSKTASTKEKTTSTVKLSKYSVQQAATKALSEKEFSSELDLTGQGLSGNFSLAVYDVKNQQTYTYQKGLQGNWYTASTIKLSVLTELLLVKNSDGSDFDENLTRNVQEMMRNSSNDATNAVIFGALASEADPIGSLFARFAMSASSSSGFLTDGWGLSTTCPLDQLILLKNIFLPSEILSSAQQAYIKNEMQSVESGQQWGISKFSPAVKTLTVKNGWGILDDDNQLVDNSIGAVTLQDGRQYLIAAYGCGFSSDESGIACQEQLIAAAGGILTGE